MKEAVFGWYPPANDPWKTYRKGAQPSYDKECLYKHGSSNYSNQRNLGVPRSPLEESLTVQGFKGHKVLTQKSATEPSAAAPPPQQKSAYRTGTPTPPTYQRPSPPPSRPHSRQAFSPKLAPDATGLFQRPQSRPTSRQSQQAKMNRAWATTSPTMIQVPPCVAPSCLEEGFRPASSLAGCLQTSPKPPSPYKTSPGKKFSAAALHKQSGGSFRSQSAASMRKTPTHDKRQIKSATSRRTRTPAELGVSELEREDAGDCSPTDDAAAAELMNLDDAPVDDGTSEAADEGEEVLGAEKEEEEKEVRGEEPELDYDEQLEKYGWRMQVPGDPLGLKSPCIPKRLPYTVKCTVPETKPRPPKVHSENYDTFFYNTIPRHPLSFTIHQEFMSEILHAKRMELLKRSGDNIPYHYKNFAFIY